MKSGGRYQISAFPPAQRRWHEGVREDYDRWQHVHAAEEVLREVSGGRCRIVHDPVRLTQESLAGLRSARKRARRVAIAAARLSARRCPRCLGHLEEMVSLFSIRSLHCTLCRWRHDEMIHAMSDWSSFPPAIDTLPAPSHGLLRASRNLAFVLTHNVLRFLRNSKRHVLRFLRKSKRLLLGEI